MRKVAAGNMFDAAPVLYALRDTAEETAFWQQWLLSTEHLVWLGRLFGFVPRSHSVQWVHGGLAMALLIGSLLSALTWTKMGPLPIIGVCLAMIGWRFFAIYVGPSLSGATRNRRRFAMTSYRLPLISKPAYREPRSHTLPPDVRPVVGDLESDMMGERYILGFPKMIKHGRPGSMFEFQGLDVPETRSLLSVFGQAWEPVA